MYPTVGYGTRLGAFTSRRWREDETPQKKKGFRTAKQSPLKKVGIEVDYNI